jgi:small subunit ribosomal protein S17
MVGKERLGVVVSSKPDKTIVVVIQRRYQHPKYGKILIQSKRYMAHDEKNECQIGDLVTIIETRPLSKTKRWNLKLIKQRSSRINISNLGE